MYQYAFRGVAQPGSAPGLGPGGRVFESHRPDHCNIMKRAKIYKPAQTAMQSGEGNSKKWLLEFDTQNSGVSPLMGWTSSKDMMSEVKLKFYTKAQAIGYAKKNKIDYYIIEPQKRKIIKKSYADNFLKNN